jgi:hypothetical protein
VSKNGSDIEQRNTKRDPGAVGTAPGEVAGDRATEAEEMVGGEERATETEAATQAATQATVEARTEAEAEAETEASTTASNCVMQSLCHKQCVIVSVSRHSPSEIKVRPVSTKTPEFYDGSTDIGAATRQLLVQLRAAW